MTINNNTKHIANLSVKRLKTMEEVGKNRHGLGTGGRGFIYHFYQTVAFCQLVGSSQHEPAAGARVHDHAAHTNRQSKESVS